MFEPNFNLSSEILKIIGLSDRLYGQLEGMRIPKKLELNLERDNQIKSSYASNSIEGNPLSLSEVTNLLLDDRVPVNRDEKEVYNYFQILNKLRDHSNEKISLDLILKIHTELLAGVKDEIAGKIRNKQIVVGKYKTDDGFLDIDIKHNPPTHDRNEIEKMLQELLSWLKQSKDLAIVKAAVFHHHFVYIHPFEDGNGRTCRLLTSLILLKENYLINKYFVLDDYYDVDRTAYSDALNSADKGDQTEWIKYFAKGMQYSLQSALSRTQSAMITIKASERPSKRESEVLQLIQEFRELTSTDIARKLKVTRQQAHNLLSSLIEKGFVEKRGKTKSSYYFLK